MMVRTNPADFTVISQQSVSPQHNRHVRSRRVVRENDTLWREGALLTPGSLCRNTHDLIQWHHGGGA